MLTYYVLYFENPKMQEKNEKNKKGRKQGDRYSVSLLNV